jgi:hypothetical protein
MVIRPNGENPPYEEDIEKYVKKPVKYKDIKLANVCRTLMSVVRDYRGLVSRFRFLCGLCQNFCINTLN